MARKVTVNSTELFEVVRVCLAVCRSVLKWRVIMCVSLYKFKLSESVSVVFRSVIVAVFERIAVEYT